MVNISSRVCVVCWVIRGPLCVIPRWVCKGCKDIVSVLSWVSVWDYDWGGICEVRENEHFVRNTCTTSYTSARSTAALARLTCSRYPDASLFGVLRPWCCKCERAMGRSMDSIEVDWDCRLMRCGSVAAMAVALQTEEAMNFTAEAQGAWFSCAAHKSCAFLRKPLLSECSS